jgi:HlyD family secretion protein
MKTPRPWTILAGLAVLALAVGGLLAWNAQRAGATRYVTAPLSVGPIVREVTASGSVNPVVNVQVGAFVSGNIQALFCDYNTQVRKGQLCAKIDPRPYQTAVDKAQADLGTQQAQLGKDQANLAYAQIGLDRATTLHAKGFDSQAALDLARTARDVAQAQIRFDQSQIRQSEAALRATRISLAYTDIASPVDGTVVARNVNVGQTVAASFQTPTLFLIAQDLTKMQVDTNVSESDIAGAAVGQPATFSVEAFPGRVFHGRVAQVRQAPVSVQNVITYDVVVAADNSDLALKPGMTATAKIVTARRDGVLRAPVQALHYVPAASQAGARNGAAGRRSPARAAAAGQRLWILRDGKPVAVPVTAGLDDDADVEVSGGGLKAGDRVIVSETKTASAAPASGQARAPGLRFGG